MKSFDIEKMNRDIAERKQIRTLAAQINLLVNPSAQLNYAVALGSPMMSNQQFLEAFVRDYLHSDTAEPPTASFLAQCLTAQLQDVRENVWYQQA